MCVRMTLSYFVYNHFWSRTSGAILSYIMCVAMNRSLPNVIFGGYGMSAPIAASGEVGVHQETDVASTVEALTQARKVIIVPGYGLAVASAQYSIAGTKQRARCNNSLLLYCTCIFLVV